MWYASRGHDILRFALGTGVVLTRDRLTPVHGYRGVGLLDRDDRCLVTVAAVGHGGAQGDFVVGGCASFVLFTRS